MTTEEKLKYLEFIQGIITRMNTCSFQIKGTALVIVSAILAIYEQNPEKAELIWICILPAIVLGLLDAYYLTQESYFRKLYDEAAGISKSPEVL